MDNSDLHKMQNEFLEIQNSLRKKLNCIDRFDKNKIKTAAGVDLAYWNTDDGEFAVCCIVVIDFKTHNVIEKQQYSGQINVPYLPGFLAFRELPLVLKAAEKLENKPDVYMFDGNGCLHPRRMGIASHASFYLDTPTVGVAKTYFRIDENAVYTEPDDKAGSFTDISLNGEVYGRALRTHDNVKPVFVSSGNYISLGTATELTMSLVSSEGRIPLPTRLADIETHIARAALQNGK